MQDVTTGGNWVKGVQDLSAFFQVHVNLQLSPNKKLKKN